jgi:hypothetical protein
MNGMTSTCLLNPVERKRRSLVLASRETRPFQRSGRVRGVRQELVARVREEIAAGEYDTPERWEAALDRMADRLM